MKWTSGSAYICLLVIDEDSDFQRLGVSNHLLLHRTDHLSFELSKCQAAPSVFRTDISVVQNPCHELSYLLTLIKYGCFLFLTYRLVITFDFFYM